MFPDKKLKIIHTEASPHWGGQEIRIFEEMKWFRQQGHEMILVAPDNGTLYKRSKAEGFKVISIYFTKPRTLLNILKMQISKTSLQQRKGGFCDTIKMLPRQSIMTKSFVQ